MKRVEWQSMDKADIIELILKQNDFPTAEAKRRARWHLEAMDALQLWEHIRIKYNNDLYVEDIIVVDHSEMKHREKELERERLKARAPVHQVHYSTPNRMGSVFSMVDEAETDIWGKSCVLKCFRYNDKINIIMSDKSKQSKLERWITKHYPNLKWEVLA